MRSLPRRRSFTAGDGGRLAYRSYSSEGTGHLVLIHGSACFGDQFHRLASHVAQTGAATVHTLDMRGHGQSDGMPGSPDRFARDIGEFIADLRRRTGNARIALGGHSAGGGLVLNTMRSGHAGELAGGLLLAPYLAVDSDTVRPHFGGWLSRIDLPRAALAVVANLFGNERFNRRPVVRFNEGAFLHDPRFVREWPFSAVFGFGPGPALAAATPIRDVPVLLIAGSADECFRADRYSTALSRQIGRAETLILPALGHWDILTDATSLQASADWLKTIFGKQKTMENRHAIQG